MAKTDQRIESWTLDSPLEEITMEMVNDPTLASNAEAGPAQTPDTSPKNGNAKPPRNKSTKKKPFRRRKS